MTLGWRGTNGGTGLAVQPPARSTPLGRLGSQLNVRAQFVLKVVIAPARAQRGEQPMKKFPKGTHHYSVRIARSGLMRAARRAGR
jgi:hypothetical protein